MPADLTQQTLCQRVTALQQLGRLEEAASLLQSAIATVPDDVDALLRLGVLRLQQDRPSDALLLLERAAALAPNSAIVLANLGTVLHALRRNEEAIAALQAALVLQPNFTDARYALATALQSDGRPEAAAACFEAIVAAAPDHLEAGYGLGIALGSIGQIDAAIARLQAVLDADPDFAEASQGLGDLLLRKKRHANAEARFRHALEIDPDYVEARLGLARALFEQKQDDGSEAAFRQVLRADAGNTTAKCGLAALYHRQQRHSQAHSLYQEVLAAHPENGGAQLGLGSALQSLGRTAEAIDAFRAAVALLPDSNEAHGCLGEALAEMGQLDGARSAFERALALAPTQTAFCLRLAHVGKVRDGDRVVAALEALAPLAATLPEEDQIRWHFAQAKVDEDLGRRDRGFDLLLAGNAAHRRTIRYDETVVLGQMRRIAKIFTADTMAARTGWGDPSPVPIFIVGMPRSGSTLVEQILASHPAVYGTGERSELADTLLRFGRARPGGLINLEMVVALGPTELRAIGAEYVAELRKLGPDAARITDKMLGNFLRVGLIHLVLPNARIIHTMRDPVDCCLSSFSRLFASGDLPYTYDLAELGHYYHAYTTLMAHWRAVLPSGVVLDVQYEDTVADLEAQARRVVAHCDLPWDPRCLAFHELERSVRTASQAQVRQPLYRSSVGRWRPDETLLRPLLDALAGR